MYLTCSKKLMGSQLSPPHAKELKHEEDKRSFIHDMSVETAADHGPQPISEHVTYDGRLPLLCTRDYIGHG